MTAIKEDWRRVEIPLVYEDAVMAAVNKPSGLLSAPDRWDKNRMHLMRLIHERFSTKWRNVHRLDCDTSGLLVCAKNKSALDFLCGQLQEHTASKTYLAILRGAPPEDEGMVDRPLTPDTKFPGRMRLASSGKSCQTTYKVLERFRHYCFVEVHPLSGRLHQIRIHMAALGCPVVGDRFYGSGDMILLSHIKKKYKPSRDGETPLMGRLALHAFRMTVQHPTGGRPVEMEAPPHKDFELSLKNLRRYAGR